MYTITKEFTFSYGHRLYGDKGKCSNIHGHTGRVKIYLASKNLDASGMVMHFDEIKRKMGGWIEENLDHRLILNNNDPILKHLTEAKETFTKFDGNPTAERLAEYIYNNLSSYGRIFKVEFWESPTSSASFQG